MELWEMIRLAAEGVLILYAGCMLYRSCKYERRAINNEREFNALMKEAKSMKLELDKKNVELAECRDELRAVEDILNNLTVSVTEKGEDDGCSDSEA